MTTDDAGVAPLQRPVMQHTPGPWVDAGLTGPNPRITGGPLRLVKCEGVVIAFLPAWLDDEHEEAHANARLVAAAPDLLNALRSLLRHAERTQEVMDEECAASRFRDDGPMSMARDALRLAVGAA
jgi:hypothetical protein